MSKSACKRNNNSFLAQEQSCTFHRISNTKTGQNVQRKTTFLFRPRRATHSNSTYHTPCETSADGVDTTRKKTSFWVETRFVLQESGGFGGLPDTVASHQQVHQHKTFHNGEKVCTHLSVTETTAAVFGRRNKIPQFP